VCVIYIYIYPTPPRTRKKKEKKKNHVIPLHALDSNSHSLSLDLPSSFTNYVSATSYH
jgi:hypothetical protein